jgi:hypothetical protein
VHFPSLIPTKTYLVIAVLAVGRHMDKVELDRNWVVTSLGNRSRVDPGVTCVGLFDRWRPWVFNALIYWFQTALRAQLSEWLRQDWVRLASTAQIHVTLIGLEASFDRGELINRNLKQIKGVEARPMAMDLAGCSRYLQAMQTPIPLRFGGFSPDAINPYDSRPPFERSFTIRPDGLIVSVGWPVLNDVIQPALVDLRKGAERFQIVHKYHVEETDCDNDAFFVLGGVTSKPWDDDGNPRNGYEDFIASLSETQCRIRESLRTAALEVAMSKEHCCVVRYPSADLAGVKEQDVLSLTTITAESMQELYRSDVR